MKGCLRCWVVLALLLLNVAAGHAHTLASTIVSVAMPRPETVIIRIAAEADPLIAKLEALAGLAASDPPTTTDHRRARLTALFPTLRAHIDARAAGTPLMLELEDVAVDDTAQTEIHLTARLPAGARTFTWRNTFIFGAYQLVTTSGSAPEAVEWLQGPQTSRSIALEHVRAEGVSSAPWLNRIGHSLAMGALVVYVICRRRVIHEDRSD